MKSDKLSHIQMAGLHEINAGGVELTCLFGTIKKGNIRLKTLWSLEDRGLIKSGIKPHLSAYGKQVMGWINLANKYEDLE